MLTDDSGMDCATSQVYGLFSFWWSQILSKLHMHQSILPMETSMSSYGRSFATWHDHNGHSYQETCLYLTAYSKIAFMIC